MEKSNTLIVSNTLKLTFLKEDITKVRTDAIVTGVGSRLEAKGMVTQALEKAFPHLRNQRENIGKNRKNSKLWSVAPSNLGRRNEAYQGKHSSHFRVVLFAIMDTKKTKNFLCDMQTLYCNIFQEVVRQGIKSLAIPLLGAGAGGVDRSLSIKALTTGVLKFQPSLPTEIVFVNLDQNILDEIYAAFDFEYHFPERRPNRSGFCRSFVSLLLGILQKLKNWLKALALSIIFIPFRFFGGWRQKKGILPRKNNQDYNRARLEENGSSVKREIAPSKLKKSKRKGKHSSAYNEFDKNEIVEAIRLSKLSAHTEGPDHILQIEDDPISAAVSSSVDATGTLEADVATDNESSCLKLDGSSHHTCPICLSSITESKQLDKCGHIFCKDCIDKSFRDYKPVCPTCNMVYGVIMGNQPDGQMDVSYSGEDLPGYEGHGTITITYYFPSGTQGEEHPSPGQPYKGTTRRAYLPDTTDGREILKLLTLSFDRKLTFTVGRSTTTGRDGVITWNDIHHKTHVDGGPARFGYPDSTYLSRVREELVSKGVYLSPTD